MVEEMASNDYLYNLIESHMRTLCNKSGGSGIVMFYDKEKKKIQSWSTDNFANLIENVKESISPESNQDELKELLSSNQLSIKDKRKLLTMIAGPPPGKRRGWWVDQNKPYFWSLTEYPFRSPNNQGGAKGAYLNGKQLDHLIDLYKKKGCKYPNNQESDPQVCNESNANSIQGDNRNRNSSSDEICNIESNEEDMDIENNSANEGNTQKDNSADISDWHSSTVESDDTEQEPIPPEYLAVCNKCPERKQRRGMLDTDGYGFCNVLRSCSISAALSLIRSSKDDTKFQEKIFKSYEQHCYDKVTEPFHAGKILYWLESEQGFTRDDKDAEEVLLTILDHNQRVKDLFTFKTKNTVNCSFCSYESTIVASNTIYYVLQEDSAVALRSSSETLVGYKCYECRKEQSGKKSCDISSYPPCLLFCIQRFTSTTDGIYKKSRRPILYEETLPTENSSVTYKLSAVTFHSGSMEKGHFKMNIRDGNQWLKIDDCQVIKVSLKNALSHQSEVHMLAYKRV